MFGSRFLMAFGCGNRIRTGNQILSKFCSSMSFRIVRIVTSGLHGHKHPEGKKNKTYHS